MSQQSLLNTFIARAQKKEKTIAIGLGESPQTNQHIIQAAIKVAANTASTIVFVGHPQIIKQSRELLKEINNKLKFAPVSDPALFLVESILNERSVQPEEGDSIGPIHAIIRGGLSSDYFLKIIRNLKHKLGQISADDRSTYTYRLALLETADGFQFFYAPVGIDEANTFIDKKNLIDNAIILLKKMDIVPKIAILSGGRLTDIGRDAWIDQNIEEAENLVRKLQKSYPDIEIKHTQILIEKAIAEKFNVIIAPEGIAGNLIYRTLVHLGAGKSYGALYLTHYNIYNKIIIDTSRSAPEYEYEGAFYMALGV